MVQLIVVMNVIDLQKLNYQEEIIINEEIEIPKDIYQNTDIIDLSKVKVIGNITNDDDFNYVVDLDLSGTMRLHDSITYDEIPYDFNVKIEESLENSLKTLDLIEFLWHYIILEVPMRFTNSEVKSIETENYRVISEEEYKKKNNPFSDFFKQ